ADRLAHVGRELELVLEELGGEHRPVRQPAHVPGPIDDLQVAVVIQKACVARANPPVGKGLAGRLRVLRVAPEDAWTPEQNLAVLRDANLHVGQGRAHGIEPDVTIALDGDEHARLGHAVELLDVHAEAAEEEEDLRADGLAGGVSAANTRESKVVLEWTV